MVNLILGLGGTGAKVVESYIHLCATGLGPDQSRVAFIDQDQSNGNTARARATLACYAAARQALKDAGGEHPEPKCRLLRTELSPHPDQANCHWVLQPGDNVNLHGLISHNRMRDAIKELPRAFFHEESELRMGLNEGYRGRPHVGSAALLMTLEDDRFWRSLERMVGEGVGDGVRVFLCGSAFGGTGAAVFPTLARRLRRLAVENGRPLRTAGVLMLPYFTFPPPDRRGANVATGHELLLQSQSALQYYHEMRDAQENSLDDLYLVGWNPAISLSHHSAGAHTQANPPLAPELFGALAAARFFRENREGDEFRLHVTARRALNSLEWDDLPTVVPDESSVPATYAAWLRFCALWHFNYARAFNAERPAGVRDEAWYRSLLGDGWKPGEAAVDIGKYVEAALHYAAAMSAFSVFSRPAGGFGLWTHGPIASVKEENQKPELDGGTLNKDLAGFNGLVRGFDDMPDAADVYWAISQKESPSSPGLWPFVAVLHECVRPK